MVDPFAGIGARFLRASAEFERILRTVRPGQWTWPTPCTEWSVRQLVNHMIRGNLNYVRLLAGGGKAEFLRLRDVDALGADPVGAFNRSMRECADAFSRHGMLAQVVDYPMGRIAGRQLLAIRTADTIVHTWDLARAVGTDDRLDPEQVAWADEHLEAIYADLAEMPTSVETTHRFFAAPEGALPEDATRQPQLLHRMGRTTGRTERTEHERPK